MEKIFNFLKKNWQYLTVILLVCLIFWDKIKKGFRSVFDPDARQRSEDGSSSDYYGSQVSNKGVKIDENGEEYFYYGNKKVRLTSGNKTKVVDYVNLLYAYLYSNTNSFLTWLTDDETHFYTGEVQATLNSYNEWCQRRETWVHYFAYIWLELHKVQFVDYLRSSMDAEAYDATKTYVTNLSMFYY